MNEKLKTYFGWVLIIFVVVVGYSVARYVDTYAKSIQPSSFRSFAVSGEGKAVAIPDIASFTFSVITQGGSNLGDLQKQNTDSANKGIAFVKAQGVDAKDISTSNYAVEPRYQYSNCGGLQGGMCPPPAIVGYTVSQTVSVKVRQADFGKLGDLIAGVVKNGANSVSALNFTVDDPSMVQNEARTKAIAEAKAKAEAVAKAGGFSVGRLLSITEDNGPYPMMQKYGQMGMMATDAAPVAAPAPSIEPGSQDISVNVVLQYEID